MNQNNIQSTQSMKTFFIKAMVSLIVIFLGVGGGIYVGSAFTGQKIGPISPQDLVNKSYLEIGENFPDYTLKELSSGNKLSIAEIVKAGPTILLFVSTTCEACHMMADFWDSRIVREIGEEVQILLIYDEEETNHQNFADNQANIRGAIGYSTDRFNQGKSDGLVSTPSIVGITPDRKIKFISSGFLKVLDADFIAKYL